MMSAIDAHQHFWQVARGDYGWLTPEVGAIYRDFGPQDLLPHLRACGIHGTVLVQAAPTLQESLYLLELAEQTPWVLGVVGWIDFEAADALAQIEQLAAHPKLRGIRPMVQDISDDDWLLRPEFGRVFKHIAALGLTFDALIYPRHLPRLLRLLDRHPELRCVVDHCAKPQIALGEFEPWASELARIARETSAFCKISGLATEAGPDWSESRLQPYVEHVLTAFGPERCLWGSDWPVLERVGTYEAWHRTAQALLAGLDEPARAAVFGGTAIAVYRLDASGIEAASGASSGRSSA
jgi:L-fuconolactonase